MEIRVALRFMILALFALRCVHGADAPASPSHRLLVSDDTKHHIAIGDKDGKIEWEYKIGGLHDLHMLPGGTILFQTNMQHIVEVDPKRHGDAGSFPAGFQIDLTAVVARRKVSRGRQYHADGC